MYSFQGKTWEQMTPQERLAHSIHNNTPWHEKQGFNPTDEAGFLSQFALGFGGGGGRAPANFWDYSDVYNPNGVTSVTETHSDGRSIGFSGSTNHFIIGDAAHKAAGIPTGGATGGATEEPADDRVDDPVEDIPVVEEPAWTLPETTSVKGSTPFLDAYMRARMAAEERGPVSRIFDQ